MKKFFVLALMLFAVQSFAQEGTRYTVDTIEITQRIDSTTVNDYTKLSVDFDKAYGKSWTTGGYYTMYVYIDSCKNSDNQWIDSVYVGDTDSLFIYVAERVPTTLEVSDTVIAEYQVRNDSTFITSGSSGAGLDFDLDKWYRFDFELSPARGYDFYVKRQCDTGGLTFRFIIVK